MDRHDALAPARESGRGADRRFCAMGSNHSAGPNAILNDADLSQSSEVRGQRSEISRRGDHARALGAFFAERNGDFLGA